MAQLPVYKDPNTNLMLMQNNWSRTLNPLLANPTNNISIIKNVSLASGPNVINHKLGHVPNGWFLVDLQNNSVIYRTEPFNKLTLTLYATNSCVASIGVF